MWFAVGLETAVQGFENMESAPENGMASQGSNPKILCEHAAAVGRVRRAQCARRENARRERTAFHAQSLGIASRRPKLHGLGAAKLSRRHRSTKAFSIT
jgi:hypothetical protein